MKRVPVKRNLADKLKVATKGTTTSKMMYKAKLGEFTLQEKKRMKDEGHYTERKNGIWVICNIKFFQLSTQLPKPNITSLKDLFDLEG